MKSILKRTLSAVLATVIAGSMLATSAFAATGDSVQIWNATDIKGKGNEQRSYEVREDAVVIPGTSVGTLGQPIWGCEGGLLDISNLYTVVYTMKLEDDSAVDGSMIFLAGDPKIRIKDAAGGMVSDTNDHRQWYTLEQLRERQAVTTDADGFFTIKYVVSPENNNYTGYAADTDNKVCIENRLAGPSAYDANLDPAEAAENRVTSEAASINLLVKSIEIQEGDTRETGEEDGWQDGHYYQGGAMVTDKLVPAVKGAGFSYVDANGDVVKNAAQVIEGATYYFDADGVSVGNKFATVDGKQLYFGTDYKLVNKAQVVTVSGVKYAVKANGEMLVNGWFEGQYFGANGKIVKGQIIAGTYGVDSLGKMIMNQVAKVGNAYYAFGADGKLVKTGKAVKLAGKMTVANKSGVVSVNKKSGSYIIGANGYCIKSTVKKIGKKTYVVGANYKVVAGTKVAKVGKKSYAVVKGVVKTAKGNQIVKIGKKKYGADKNGKILMNKKVKVGKKTYKTNKKGIATLKK